MFDRHLQQQLSEIKSVVRSPLLWREETRSTLLAKIDSIPPLSYSWGERLQLIFQQLRLVLAPLHLAPLVGVLLIMLAGYMPLTSALAASLPGSPLYSIKRAVEKIELSLRSSSDSQGLFYLTLAGRRLAEAKAVNDPEVQAALLRDYNITLGFAQASLEAGLPSQDLVKAYDQATAFWSADLATLTVAPANQQVYKVALDLTGKISSRALTLMVSQHGANQSVQDEEVAQRLVNEITKVEAKLEGVEIKVKDFPPTKPLPRVVLERQAVVVPVIEASKQAKANLDEARELVARKEFSLALEKVQESEDLTSKSEAAVSVEQAQEVKPIDNSTPLDKNTTPTGEVKGESVAPSAEQQTPPAPEPVSRSESIEVDETSTAANGQ